MLGVGAASDRPDTPSGFIGNFIQEHIFGELWQREAIDLRTRSLCTFPSRSSPGSARGRCSEENHVLGALANGATPDEILEVIVHTAFYAGLPVLPGSMRAAQEVFDGHWGAQVVGQ